MSNNNKKEWNKILIYGNNGSGKTLYKEKYHKQYHDSCIVLNSKLTDWWIGDLNKISSDHFSDSFSSFSLEENLKQKDKYKKSILEYIEKIIKGDFSIKDKKDREKLFPEFFSKKIMYKDILNIFNEKIIKNDFLKLKSGEIKNYIEIYLKDSKWKEYNLLSDKQKNKLKLYITISDRLTKSKRTVIDNNEKIEIFEKYNSLISSFEHFEKMIKKEIGESSSLLKINLQQINIFDEKGNLYKETLNSEIRNYVLNDLKSRNNFMTEVKEFSKLFNNNITFLENEEYKNLIKEIFPDLETDFLNDGKRINFKMKGNKRNLSSGQISFISAYFIITSSKKETILVDDLYESLDYKLKLRLSFLISRLNKNFYIFTHEHDLINTIKKTIPGMKYIDLKTIEPDISEVVDKVIDTKGKAYKYDWPKLLNKYWDAKNQNERHVFETLIIKMITRTYAKNGSLHFSYEKTSIDEINKSPNFNHYNDSSTFIFHYSNNINYEIINKYFKFLNIKNNIDSIKLIESIKKYNNKSTEEWKISKEKLNNFLDELLKAHKIEKLVLKKTNKYPSPNNKAEYIKKLIDENPRLFDNDLKSKYELLKNKQHEIDYSPDYILK